MTRPRSLLAVLACLLGLAGCGAAHTTSKATSPPSATRRASTTSATTSPGVPVGEHAAVSQFAAAYVRFLDGAATASGLPDTTPSVRTLAGRRAGAIPPARRQGTLVITQLRPAVGAGNSYLLTARDDAHALYAQITLAQQDGRWLVAQLTPPDFVQVLAPAGPPPPAPPPGSTAAQNAARLFLHGYLPWLYGQAPLRAITAATSGLLKDLKAHPPRIPPMIQALAPKVEAIAIQRRPNGWQALANISDAHETYELVLTVAQTHGRWLVSNVSSPR